MFHNRDVQLFSQAIDVKIMHNFFQIRGNTNEKQEQNNHLIDSTHKKCTFPLSLIQFSQDGPLYILMG